MINISTGCAQEKDIHTYLQKVEATGKLNGNVLVIKNDTVLYENSFGYKEGTKTKKLNKHHRFNIGSIYKEFPAVAIIQLRDQGKLQLDDKLSKYIQDLPEWSHQVTIKSLLQYSSGLPKIKFGEYFSNGFTVTDELIMNDLKKIKKLEFEPETDYLYTNYSPQLLMMIVESISQQKFQSYVQLNLFDKYQLNGMEISKQYPYPDTTLMAIPFNEDFLEDDYKISVSGILFSATAHDMYQWFHNLDTFKILPRESLKFLSEEAISGDNIQAPLGRCDWVNEDVELHLHHGSSASYESLVRHHKKEGLMIILLTNQKQGNLHDIADKIYGIAQK